LQIIEAKIQKYQFCLKKDAKNVEAKAFILEAESLASIGVNFSATKMTKFSLQLFAYF
jgi:hypothetical protein